MMKSKRLGVRLPSSTETDGFTSFDTSGAALPAREDAGTDYFNHLSRTRRLFIFGELTGEVARDIIDGALFLADEDPAKDIFVYLNTPGGEIDGAIAIFDIFQAIGPIVNTVVCGSALSAGALVAISGAKGKRSITPNSTMMLHQLRWELGSKLKDMEIAMRELKRLNDATEAIISATTNIPKKKIKAMLEYDYWMDAAAAIELGFVDRYYP